MAQEPTALPPQLYLLRVWHEPGFRAVLRPVGGSSPGHVFHQPQQIGEFVASRGTADCPDDEEAAR
jgi:hypothetical protein